MKGDNIVVDTSKYKEPFRKVDSGYGYYGILSESKDGKYVQCHVCGEWFSALQNHHLKTHGFNSAADYKDRYRLSRKTSLVSRKRRVAMAKAYIATAKKHGWNATTFKESAREKSIEHNKGRKVLTLEMQNKRGTCRDQLIEKIKEVAKTYKTDNPTKKMFLEHFHKKYQTRLRAEFGSWREAANAAGYKTITDIRKEKYSDDAMLEVLRRFYQINGRLSQAHDHRRLTELPDYSLYIRRFGSIFRARELAGLPTKVEQFHNSFSYIKPKKR